MRKTCSKTLWKKHQQFTNELMKFNQMGNNYVIVGYSDDISTCDLSKPLDDDNNFGGVRIDGKIDYDSDTDLDKLVSILCDMIEYLDDRFDNPHGAMEHMLNWIDRSDNTDYMSKEVA